jgi:hypothetical protein
LTKQTAINNEKLFLHITLFFSLVCFSQNEQLAQYYDKGDFEKQKSAMKNCQTQNSQYFLRIIDCSQQLKQYECRKALQQRFAQYQQGNILVELYNNLLQKKDAKANTYFDQALERIKKNPKEVYE